MSVDTFKSRELSDLAGLAEMVAKFNREQTSEKPLFAEVTLYRGGNEVALLTEAASFGEGARGDLVLEVKEK